MVQHYADIDLTSISNAANYVASAASSPAMHALTGLGAVNLLVGPNNAGKSRFMRALFAAPSFRYRPTGVDMAQVQERVASFSALVRQSLSGNLVSYGSLKGASHFDAYARDWMDTKELWVAELRTQLDAVINNKAFSPTFRGGYSAPSDDQVKGIHAPIAKAAQGLKQYIDAIQTSVGDEPRVYVPILRGLRPLDGLNDLYADRTRKDYGLPGPSDDRAVFTGLTLYDYLRSLLLGSREERARVDAYEEFLANELFDGREVELIPRRDGDVVCLRVGSEEELPIHQLGDGMQSLIVITFSAFTATKRSLIFVEEPDTHLHPGMQRKLLELFLRNDQLKRHQVFFTTHSNHFLDMAADYGGCATLLFRKQPDAMNKFTITTIRQNDRLILDELGVRASSVFLTNATIWVEGITDRLYLREYLRRYFEEQELSAVLREDTHYSFMEGGGANIAHFDFAAAPSAVDELVEQVKVARICTNSFVLLDGDNNGKPRVDKLREHLQDRLLIINGKEVENLLPLGIIKEYVKHRLGDDVSLDALTLDSYHEKSKALGSVLDATFGTEIFTDNQTIKNKGGVCNFCVTRMRSSAEWQLTPEARKVCEALTKFILGSNGLAATHQSAR